MAPAEAKKLRMTVEEYFAFDAASDRRWTYVDGEIFDLSEGTVAMAGASPVHNAIAFNFAGQLYVQLRGKPCRGSASDTRVKADAIYTYPDIVVVCGERRYDVANPPTLLNPTVVIEVLSPSTEAFDRRKKADGYRSIESLTDYLFVAQDEVFIEHFTRSGAQWTAQNLHPGERIVLASVGVDIAVDDVYERVFEAV